MFVNVLFTFQDESDQRPFVARVLSRMANYEGGIVPNIEQEGVEEEDADEKSKKKAKKAKVRLVRL